MLTQSRLKELLCYESGTGVFTWLNPTSNRVKPGDVAGKSLVRGYQTLSVDGKRYYLHRLAWLYETGSMPEDCIDHIDGNPLNNKISNLRCASRKQNQYNMKRNSANTSGYKGVHFHSGTGKWRAVVSVDNKPKHLGLFQTAIDAAQAYNQWCANNRGEFARLNQL